MRTVVISLVVAVVAITTLGVAMVRNHWAWEAGPVRVACDELSLFGYTATLCSVAVGDRGITVTL